MGYVGCSVALWKDSSNILGISGYGKWVAEPYEDD